MNKLSFYLRAENKTVIRNFFALGVLQGTNFLLPLITIPYLIRTIGPEKFGTVAIAQAFMTYFMLITDYGFNLSATRQISISREDPSRLSLIFTSVLITKALICLGMLGLVVIAIENYPPFRHERILFYLSFSLVIGQTIFPVWFFQGIEKMKFITGLNLLAKVILTVLIFTLVKKTNDYRYVTLFYATGTIVSGVAAVVIVFRNFKVKFSIPTWPDIGFQLKDGWYKFLTTFATGVTVYVNVFILSFFADSRSVGYYSIAEKIVIAVWQISTVFAQAIYPYVCSLTTGHFSRIVIFLRKIYWPFCLGMFGLCLCIFFFAELIVSTVAGAQYPEVVNLLRILSFTPFVITLNIPAYQILLAFDFPKSFTSVFIAAAFVNVLLNIILTNYFGFYGTAWCVFVTHAMIMLSLYLVIEMRHKQYSLIPLFAFKSPENPEHEEAA